MKSLLILLTGITTILLLGSCKKENNSEPIRNANLLKSYTEDIKSSSVGNSVTTYNITYDGNNRLVSIISASSPGDKFLYTFSSTDKYSMDLYNSNVLSIHEDFFLNGDSFLDSTYQYNDTQDTSTEKYFYNTNNQLIQLKEFNYSTVDGSELSNTTTYTYDANGNLARSADTDLSVITNEYYTDLSYVAPVILGLLNSNSTKKYSLVKKSTLTSNGYLVGSANHTYTFDANTRISTDKAITDDGSIIIKTYTYFP